jgi:hypothetical protein
MYLCGNIGVTSGKFLVGRREKFDITKYILGISGVYRGVRVQTPLGPKKKKDNCFIINDV